MGGRAHLLVALSESQDEQRLREVVHHWGGVHLCSDESIDGEALGSLMRLFGRFLTAGCSEFDLVYHEQLTLAGGHAIKRTRPRGCDVRQFHRKPL